MPSGQEVDSLTVHSTACAFEYVRHQPGSSHSVIVHPKVKAKLVANPVSLNTKNIEQ